MPNDTPAADSRDTEADAALRIAIEELRVKRSQFGFGIGAPMVELFHAIDRVLAAASVPEDHE